MGNVAAENLESQEAWNGVLFDRFLKYRNVRAAMSPDGRLCMIVWRRKVDNPGLYVAENVVKPLIDEPDETDEPRCGPGPFSMADADTVSGQLKSAGFREITLRRHDRTL